MNHKVSPAFLVFLINVVGLLISYFFLIPYFVLPVDHVQIDVSNENIKVMYDNTLINSTKLDSPLQTDELAITINHDHYFSFRHLYPHFQDTFLLTNLSDGTNQYLEKKLLRQHPFTKLGPLLNPYINMFVAEYLYPNHEYSTTVLRTDLPDNFRIKIETTNVHDINISIDEGNIFLRPQWHYENTVKTHDQTSQGKPLDFIDLPHQFTKIIFSNLFGLFLFLIVIFIIALIIKPFSYFSRHLKLQIRGDYYIYIAIIISVLFFAYSAWVSTDIFHSIPHSQDEVAYLFQSKIFASGSLYARSLPEPYQRFFDHEFIINNGKWFGKYPPGTSILFALGQYINSPMIINPLLGSASIIFLYLIAAKLFSKKVGLLAALLFALSPFHVMISSSYLSHSSALFMMLLSVYFLLSKRFLFSGIFLGALLIIRPFNAALLGIIFLLYIAKSIRLNKLTSVGRTLILIGVGTIPCVLFSMLYSYALTGNVLTPIFNAYSSTDTIGFGLRGVEWGADFTVFHAIINLLFNFNSLQDVILGWPFFLSFVLIPFSIFDKHRQSTIFIALIISLQVVGYFFYFGRGTFYGPRYWYEISPFIIMILAVGFFVLHDHMKKWHLPYSLNILIFLLIIFGIVRTIVFLPNLKNHNGMVLIDPPKPIHTPAVVFISGDGAWYDYGKYFTLQSANLNEDIIYARDKGYYPINSQLDPIDNKTIKDIFPERHLYQLVDKVLTPIN